jgi:FkbM family methyltransferase
MSNTVNIARKINRILRDLKHPLRAVDPMLWTSRARRRRTFRNETIYDVGMHEGQDTAFYLKKGFRVVAVEANRVLTDAASKLFAPFIAAGQLSILNIGITENESDSDLEFFVTDRISEWSSFNRDVAGRDASPIHSVFVPTRTLASIIAEFGPAYNVKIDIEGYDAIALRSLLTVEPKPRYISVENGNQGMLGMLVSAGYDRFKYIQQKAISELCVSLPSREGDYTGHLFPRGASGPFGEETPGKWVAAERIRTEISKVWDVDGLAKQSGHDDRIHGWFDLHARHSSAPMQPVNG